MFFDEFLWSVIKLNMWSVNLPWTKKRHEKGLSKSSINHSRSFPSSRSTTFPSSFFELFLYRLFHFYSIQHFHNCQYTCKDLFILMIISYIVNHHHTRPADCCKWCASTGILVLAFTPSRQFLIFPNYLANHVRLENVQSLLPNKRLVLCSFHMMQ